MVWYLDPNGDPIPTTYEFWGCSAVITNMKVTTASTGGAITWSYIKKTDVEVLNGSVWGIVKGTSYGGTKRKAVVNSSGYLTSLDNTGEAIVTLPWSAVTATPTLLSGSGSYGVTRGLSLDNVAGLTGTSGHLRKTGDLTWDLDPTAYGTGTVTSIAALTLGTIGTDLSSSVSGGSTAATITLNVPTASANNRGALSSTDWSAFAGKQAALNGTGLVKMTGTLVSYDNTTYYSSSNLPAYPTLGSLGAQAALNGTGLVRMSGTTVSYDNATYLSSSVAIAVPIRFYYEAWVDVVDKQPLYRVQKASIITAIRWYRNDSTTVSGSTVFYLKKNGTTIATYGTLTIATAASATTWTDFYTGLSIALAAGDYLELSVATGNTTMMGLTIQVDITQALS